MQAKHDALLAEAEAFAKDSRHDLDAQQNWARSCSPEIKAFLRAIVANTPIASSSIEGAIEDARNRPHNSGIPSLGSVSYDLRGLIDACRREWGDL